MLKFNWHTKIENEIWICENFFPRKMKDEIISQFRTAPSTELQPDHEIRDKFRKSQVNPTLYSYKVYQSNIRVHSDFSHHIMTGLGKLLAQLDYPSPISDHYNPLQIFLKSFTSNSYYELHTEPLSYGPFAYLIFLEDVPKGGELIFPDIKGTESYLKKYPHIRPIWEENVKLLQKEGSLVRYIGPEVIKPKANMAVLFKVGSAHYVESSPDAIGDFRSTVAGWPYAKEELINRLDENCHISSYFEPPQK